MDYLNTYKPFQEEIVFMALEKKVFQLLPDGKTGAWLVKQNSEYSWVGDDYLEFDLLKNFDCLRNAMTGKSLILTFKEKLFIVELTYKKREGGYEESFQDICIASATAHSLVDALNFLNNKLRKQEETCISSSLNKTSMIDFQTYKLNRKLY